MLTSSLLAQQICGAIDCKTPACLLQTFTTKKEVRHCLLHYNLSELSADSVSADSHVTDLVISDPDELQRQTYEFKCTWKDAIVDVVMKMYDLQKGEEDSFRTTTSALSPGKAKAKKRPLPTEDAAATTTATTATTTATTTTTTAASARSKRLSLWRTDIGKVNSDEVLMAIEQREKELVRQNQVSCPLFLSLSLHIHPYTSLYTLIHHYTPLYTHVHPYTPIYTPILHYTRSEIGPSLALDVALPTPSSIQGTLYYCTALLYYYLYHFLSLYNANCS